MNILLICSEYDEPKLIGGIGSFSQSLSEQMVKMGHTVTILGLYKNSSCYQKNGVDVVKIKKIKQGRRSYFLPFINRWKIYKSFKKIDKRKKINIVEAPENDADAFFISLLDSKRLVTRLHLSNTVFRQLISGKKPRLMHLLEKLQIEKSKGLIACSNYIVKETSILLTPSAQRARVIYNSVPDIKVTRKHSDIDVLQILFAGKITEAKGADIFLKAIKKLLELDAKINVIVVGREVEYDPVYDSTHHIIQELTAYDNFDFLGLVPRDQLFQIMSRFDIAIYPSRSEAFPILWVESLKVGLPVIAPNDVVGPELIQNNKNGFLLMQNNPEKIVTLVENLLKSDTLSKDINRMSDHAKDSVKNFTDENLAIETERYYKEIA